MSTPSAEALIPLGTWTVDPDDSELTFAARGMFGLAKVTGSFVRFEGELSVTADATTGELRIVAESLDTRNARRDTHLRSADFFDVENHPVVTFVLAGITADDAPEPSMNGELRIRNSRLPVRAPLTVDPLTGDRLRLATELSVDRAAAGVGWSRLGMIRGDARLQATVTLMR